MDKKVLVLIGGAVLLIGMVMGMEMFSWSPKPERRTVGVPRPGLYGGTQAPSAKRGRITFRDLLGLMLAKASNPATREFAAEFQGTQSLRTAWEDFRESDNTDAFVRTLQEDPAFNALAEKYGESSEFQDAAEALANEPGMEEIIRKLMSERRPVVVVRKEEAAPKEKPAEEGPIGTSKKPYTTEPAAEGTSAAQTTGRIMRPVSGQGTAATKGAVKKQPPRYEDPGLYNDKLDPIPLIKGKPLSLENLGVDPALQQQLQQAPQAAPGGEPFTSLMQQKSPSTEQKRKLEPVKR